MSPRRHPIAPPRADPDRRKEVPVIALDPKYSVGIVEMDAQHAHWIQIIDEFKAVAGGELDEQAKIDAAARALEQLQSYTVSHFASEEQLLATHGYPGLDAHKKQHGELAALVGKLLGQARTPSNHNTPLKLNLLATIWLLEHITNEDLKCAQFILGKAAAGARAA